MQDKNSILPMLLFVAKSETFLSKVAAPTSILFFSNNFMYENFEPSFITGPLTPEFLLKYLSQLLEC